MGEKGKSKLKPMCKKCGLRKRNRTGGLCGRCFKESGELENVRTGSNGQLTAMRLASRQVDGTVTGREQVDFYIRLKEKSPKTFSEQWERLEREYRENVAREKEEQKRVKAAKKGVGVEDGGSDRALELIEYLLKGAAEAAGGVGDGEVIVGGAGAGVG